MTIINDLAAELGVDPDSLRITLTEGSEAETLTPNYLSVGADGKVSASFSGHVKASGIDLQGGQAATNAIDWLRNSDGSVIAQILGYDTADGTGLPKTGNLQLAVSGDATGTAGISIRPAKGTGAGLRAMSLSLDALESGLLVSSNAGLAAQKIVKIWNGGVVNTPANSDFAWDAFKHGRVFLNTAFSMPNAAWTKVPLDTLENMGDNDSMWDAVNKRFTINTAGTYLLMGSIDWSGPGAAGTQRLVGVLVNGFIRASGSGAPGLGAARGTAVNAWQCAQGDTIELWGFQDTGAALPLTLTSSPIAGNPGNVNTLTIVRIGA